MGLQPSEYEEWESQQLTYLQEDHLASQPVLPGSEEARKTTAGSGRRLSGCLVSSSPVGRCLKTLLESSQWASTICYLMWRGRGTKSGRPLFQLVPSTPRIDGTGCGLWPTVTQFDATCGDLMGKEYTGKNKHAMKLIQAVRMFPTPHATCSTGPGTQGRQGGENLQTAIGGTLNPTFVEWLMGYPEGWTDLEHSGTPSCPR